MLSLNYRPQPTYYFLAHIPCPQCKALLHIHTSWQDGLMRRSWGFCINPDCKWSGDIVTNSETKEVQLCN